jgi:hypothetical protein
LTLQNVQINLQGGGLTFNSNATLARSVVTNNFAGTALTFNATTQSALVSSLIVSNNGAANGDVVRVNTANAANNLISGNTIVSNAVVDQTLLHYFGTNTITDRVVGNTFVGNSGFSARPLFLTDAIGVNGLKVTDNSFRDSDTNQVAIAVGVNTQNLLLARNTITLTGASGTIGINVVGGGANPTSVTLSTNLISTNGNGTGVQFIRTLAGGVFNARVEGNDLHTNKIGIFISGSLAGSATGIDLGGGSQGSLGGNNFRSFSAAASATAGAIVTTVLAADGPVSAQLNIFGVPSPDTVIFDQTDVAGNAKVNSAVNLTGNPAFVQTLYTEFLKRPGDLSAASDAGGWVNQLAAGASASAVANGIIRSAEALGVRVDALYRQFLKREAEPQGRAAFISLFQTGTTLEGVIKTITTSFEYSLLYGSAGAFVQSLSVNLLNRTATNGEVIPWEQIALAEGRAISADTFLTSPEYRTVAVKRLYSDLLNRPNPSAFEVSGWGNSGVDILSITVQIAASPEFQANG